MKKVVALNLLIVFVHFPYVVGRWLDAPYFSPEFWPEDLMVLGTMAVGPFLLLNTILLVLIQWKWPQKVQYCLFLNGILLGLTLLYTIYSGVIISLEGRAVWVDVLAAFILFLALRATRAQLESVT